MLTEGYQTIRRRDLGYRYEGVGKRYSAADIRRFIKATELQQRDKPSTITVTLEPTEYGLVVGELDGLTLPEACNRLAVIREDGTMDQAVIQRWGGPDQPPIYPKAIIRSGDRLVLMSPDLKEGHYMIPVGSSDPVLK